MIHSGPGRPAKVKPETPKVKPEPQLVVPTPTAPISVNTEYMAFVEVSARSLPSQICERYEGRSLTLIFATLVFATNKTQVLSFMMFS